MSLTLYLHWRSGECLCSTCGNRHTAPPEAIPTETTLFSRNITHNLGGMFKEAGVYEILWRGDGLRAGDVLPRLQAALLAMEAEPARFKAFDSPNGWGIYPHALDFLRDVIRGCESFPAAVLVCSR